MEINVSNLKSEINRYNKIINDYEENILNLYNELFQTQTYWQDGNSIKFINTLELEKRQTNNKIAELKSISDILKYITTEYEKIGNKIAFDLSTKNLIDTYFNNYISKIDNIIKKYNSLDISFCPNEAIVLKDERNKLQAIKSDVLDIKQKINKTFKQLEEIETQIKNKLEKINIEYITENSVSDFI